MEIVNNMSCLKVSGKMSPTAPPQKKTRIFNPYFFAILEFVKRLLEMQLHGLFNVLGSALWRESAQDTYTEHTHGLSQQTSCYTIPWLQTRKNTVPALGHSTVTIVPLYLKVPLEIARPPAQRRVGIPLSQEYCESFIGFNFVCMLFGTNVV